MGDNTYFNEELGHYPAGVEESEEKGDLGET